MKEDEKCAKCGEGIMKYKLATEPLSATIPKNKPRQAECNKCGFQDDYDKFYPVGAK
jgi:hypothetical protein